MELTAKQVRAEIARLEQKLASGSQPAKPRIAHEMSATRKLLAEIDELEEQIDGLDTEDETTASDDNDADDIGGDFDTEDETTASDDEDADDEDETMTASETEKGIEDEITQDKFHEMEDISETTKTSGPSMLSVAPTGYTARLMQASERLDKVAAYLEKNGQTKLAYRLDRVADAIDAHLKQSK
jgi:hypothetical protein